MNVRERCIQHESNKTTYEDLRYWHIDRVGIHVKGEWMMKGCNLRILFIARSFFFFLAFRVLHFTKLHPVTFKFSFGSHFFLEKLKKIIEITRFSMILNVWNSCISCVDRSFCTSCRLDASGSLERKTLWDSIPFNKQKSLIRRGVDMEILLSVNSIPYTRKRLKACLKDKWAKQQDRYYDFCLNKYHSFKILKSSRVVLTF